jgi:hypothetical protein
MCLKSLFITRPKRRAGREVSAPTSYIIATPTPLGQRKAASRQPIVRGCSGVAGVPSPGHAARPVRSPPSCAPRYGSLLIWINGVDVDPGA